VRQQHAAMAVGRIWWVNCAWIPGLPMHPKHLALVAIQMQPASWKFCLAACPVAHDWPP
jgi:hypothetical protein